MAMRRSKLADLLTDRDGRKNVLIGLLGLVAAVGVPVLGLVISRSYNSAANPAAQPTSSPSVIVEGWQRVPDQPGVFGNADIEQLTSVMYRSGTYLAVGSHAYEPAVWRATDPRHWTRLTRVEEGTSDRPAMIWSLAYDGGRYVAVGQESDHAAVWTSVNGTTWRLSPRAAGTFGQPGEYSAMHSIVSFHHRWYAGGDFAAGGRTAQVATVWTSDDGTHWTRITPSTESSRVPGDRPTITAMHATSDMIVAVGSNNSLADGATTCGVWTSRDGSNWSAAHVTGGTLTPKGQPCVLDAVTTAHGVWLAVGAVSGDPQVWTSPDGVSWSRVVGALFTNGYGMTEVNGVAATQRGWVAVGDDPGPSLVTDAAVWDSSDARRWLRVHPDPAVFGGPDRQVMSAVITTDSGAVAVGWDGSSGQSRGAVWVQHPVPGS